MKSSCAMLQSVSTLKCQCISGVSSSATAEKEASTYSRWKKALCLLQQTILSISKTRNLKFLLSITWHHKQTQLLLDVIPRMTLGKVRINWPTWRCERTVTTVRLTERNSPVLKKHCTFFRSLESRYTLLAQRGYASRFFVQSDIHRMISHFTAGNVSRHQASARPAY